MIEGQKQAIRWLKPPVDVYETEEGIQLQLDVAGVTEESVDIEVDRELVTVRARIDLDTPEDIEWLYADIEYTGYARVFSLSPELALDKIEASLIQGVLILIIPRKECTELTSVPIRFG